jgi:hypothetical protein
MIQAGIGALLPMGGALMELRNRYLEKNVPESLDKMLQSGLDLNGKPLSEEDKTSLQSAYDKIKAEPVQKHGTGLIGGLLGGLFKPTQQPATTENSRAPSGTGAGSHTGNVSPTAIVSGPMGSAGKTDNRKSSGLSKGGFITKRMATC